MKLPGLHAAVVPEKKINWYLLSLSHPSGRTKAAFFSRFGFTSDSWQVLKKSLMSHAADHDVSTIEESDFGIKYIVEGELRTPDGRNPIVRVVWFIARGQTTPHLVTAYPCEQRS